VGLRRPARSHPIKRSAESPLHIDNRCYNQLIAALRARPPNPETPQDVGKVSYLAE